MVNLSIENDGNDIVANYSLQPNDRIDNLTLGMMINNDIEGLLPVVPLQDGDNRFLKYTASSMVSMKKYLGEVVNKEKLLKVFLGIARCIIGSSEYMVNLTSFVLEKDKIFINVETGEVGIICIPLLSVANDGNTCNFFKMTMFGCQFDPEENGDYVGKLITILNPKTYSIESFVEELENMLEIEHVSQNDTLEEYLEEAQNEETQDEETQDEETQDEETQDEETKDQEDEQNSSNNENTEVTLDAETDDEDVAEKIKKITEDNDSIDEIDQLEESRVDVESKDSIDDTVVEVEETQKEEIEIEEIETEEVETEEVETEEVETEEVENEKTEVEEVETQNAEADEKSEDIDSEEVKEASSIAEDDNLEESSVSDESDTQEEKSEIPFIINTKHDEMIMIDRDNFRIGSSRDLVDYCIFDNNTVSDVHVHFTHNDSGEYFVTDNNSQYGTFMNGVMIQPDEEIYIPHGAQIRLGTEEFEFKMH